jgi:hypothetical protein
MNRIMKFSALIVVLALVFTSCVKNEVTEISLDRTSVLMVVGQTDSIIASLTATGDITKLPKTWTSSNVAVATVKNGVLVAKTTGTTIITVQAGEKTATCTVTVDDKILPTLTKGELWFWGDAYGTATDTVAVTSANNFTIYLGSAGINMTDLSGIGEVLVLELNSSISIKDSIQVGIYDMMPELSRVHLTEKTLVPAYYDSNNTQWGCWYYGSSINPIVMGNVVVSKTDNNYKLVYELFDDYGVRIAGTYQGALSFVDGTQSGVKAALKSSHNSRFQPALKLTRRN